MRFYDDRPIVENKTTVRGVGFTGLLTILFIALKLTGVIDWSWGWVLSPLWIGAIISIVIFVVMVVLYMWLDKS